MKIPKLSEEHKRKIGIASKKSWSNPQVREKHVQAAKKIWLNSEYREKVSEAIKKALNVPEVKKRKGESSKKSWANSKIWKRRQNGIKKALTTPKCRKEKSKILKNLWNDSEYRNKITERVREACSLQTKSGQERAKKISESTKKFKSNPEVKKKISESSKKMWANRQPEARKKIIEATFNNPEFQKKRMAGLHLKPNRKERFLFGLIKPLGFKYVGDGSLIIEKCSPDFVNYQKHLIIELYGDYWHRNDNPKEKVRFFKKYGYDTIVIWEHELNDPLLLGRIKKFIYVKEGYIV